MADLLLIGAVLSWGGYLTVSKPLIMRHGSLPVLTATFLVGSLLDLPIALIASPHFRPCPRCPTPAWIALAFLTLFITPVNLACQNLALRRLDASQVANFSNVSPILTVVWGAWLFGEPLTTSLILGGRYARRRRLDRSYPRLEGSAAVDGPWISDRELDTPAVAARWSRRFPAGR